VIEWINCFLRIHVTILINCDQSCRLCISSCLLILGCYGKRALYVVIRTMVKVSNAFSNSLKNTNVSQSWIMKPAPILILLKICQVNLLKPNDIYIYIYIYIYICRNAALTSRRYILNIYSTIIHTKYFKHAA